MKRPNNYREFMSKYPFIKFCGEEIYHIKIKPSFGCTLSIIGKISLINLDYLAIETKEENIKILYTRIVDIAPILSKMFSLID